MTFEEIWYGITLLGSPDYWVLLTAVLFFGYLIIREDIKPGHEEFLRRLLIILIPTLTITLMTVQVMKLTIPIERICIPCSDMGLERPLDCNPYCPEGNSFPSGHAASAFAGITSVFLINPRRKYLIVFSIPILVSLSRIFLGVHTILDILAGSIIAIIIASVIKKAETRIKAL